MVSASRMLKNYYSLFSRVAFLRGKRINILCSGIFLKYSFRKETKGIWPLCSCWSLLGLVLIICCSTMGPNARSILFYGSSAPSEPLDSLACVEVLFVEFCPSLPRENHLSGGRMQLFIFMGCWLLNICSLGVLLYATTWKVCFGMGSLTFIPARIQVQGP